MPKISIVMPTFQQEKFILAAIDSILNQTFQDFQLIIVNDGSTDNTLNLALSRSKDPRVHVITQTNGGTGSALNTGFKIAAGRYETWWASDNIMYPMALSRLNKYLDKHFNIDYVYANCDIGVMSESGLTEIKRKNIKTECDQKWNCEKLYHHCFVGIMWLWRCELRIKAGDFQKEPCEDYDMTLKMADAGGRFAFLDENLAWFRRHKENMSYKLHGKKPNYTDMVRNKHQFERA